MYWFPYLAESGVDAEYSFMFAVVHSDKAYWAFLLYYSAVAYILLLAIFGITMVLMRSSRRSAFPFGKKLIR